MYVVFYLILLCAPACRTASFSDPKVSSSIESASLKHYINELCKLPADLPQILLLDVDASVLREVSQSCTNEMLGIKPFRQGHQLNALRDSNGNIVSSNERVVSVSCYSRCIPIATLNNIGGVDKHVDAISVVSWYSAGSSLKVVYYFLRKRSDGMWHVIEERTRRQIG